VESLNGSIIVEPQPCGLESATGVVPTRYGFVKIAWEVKDGRLYVKADIPQNAEVEFLEPTGFEGRTDYDRST
jgi:hypothetical protein